MKSSPPTSWEHLSLSRRITNLSYLSWGPSSFTKNTQIRLRLDRFNYQIVHVPGKHLHTADTLSCAPTSSPTPDDVILEEVADAAMMMCIAYLPAGTERLREYTSAQDSGRHDLLSSEDLLQSRMARQVRHRTRTETILGEERRADVVWRSSVMWLSYHRP